MTVRTRPLGNTSVELSEVAQGTWGLAAESYGIVDDTAFEGVIAKALEVGITSFDLAPLWGDGRAERTVAKVVGDRRDQVQYITRAGIQYSKTNCAQRAYDVISLRRDLDASLERLKTDRIDVWLLHDPPEGVWDNPKLKEMLEALRKEERIRVWGASVGHAAQARRAIAAGARVLCLPYNLLYGELLHELAGDLQEASCGVLARSPLAYGLLAGRWSEYRTFGTQDHRRHRWEPQAFRTRVRQAGRLRYLIHDDVTRLEDAALRYVLANDRVTSVLVGARTPAQIEQAAKNGKGPPYLPEDDLTRVAQVLAARDR